MDEKEKGNEDTEQDSLSSEDVAYSPESNDVFSPGDLRCEEEIPPQTSKHRQVNNVFECVDQNLGEQSQRTSRPVLDQPNANATSSVDAKTQLIVDLRKHISLLKLRDETHEREIQILQQEIARLNETILKLLAENNQLSIDLHEAVVHSVTQYARPMSDEEHQRSLITNIKAKKRKGTEKKRVRVPWSNIKANKVYGQIDRVRPKIV